MSKPRIRVRTDGTFVGSPQPSAAYMRSDSLPTLFRWNPALREANDDVRSAWRSATARTIEVMQNNGWLSGAVEQSASHVVGDGLKLNCKPDWESLGWDSQTANDWARRVEARFAAWANSSRSCDAAERSTFGELQNMAYEHWMATGEVLASIPFKRLPGTIWGTKVRLMPAWRLSSKTDTMRNMTNGVVTDDNDAPVAYLILSKNTFGGETESTVRAAEPFGRKLIIHVFRGTPAQTRGITPFVSVLKVTRQFDQLADATLTAALIQAVFAAMFKSQAPTDEVLGGMQTSTEQANAVLSLATQRAKWYEQTDFDLGQHGRVLHGYPGDELQFFRSEHPNQTYEPFAKFLLREISRASALTYEEFSGDYAGATFSSSKMGTVSTWPRIRRRRRSIVAPFCQSMFEAWLEEDIELGGTEFPGGVPGFLQSKELAARAEWIGPTQPHPDELKSARAAEVYQKIGVPDAHLFDELGLDADEAYEQRAREQERKKQLGLNVQPEQPQSPPVPPEQGEEEDDEEQTNGGE